MKKEVIILIKDAKYYQEHSSLVVVGVEVETQRPITQQITLKSFLENTGIFSQQEVEQVLNDPARCRMFASQLKSRKAPFKLVFEDSKTEEQGI